METRHTLNAHKTSELPLDYLKMVTDVFSNNFADGLRNLTRSRGQVHFDAQGLISPMEVILAVSLTEKDSIASITAFASVDFDPQASSPTAEDCLSCCVDALGSVFDELFSAENQAALQEHDLESMAELPQLWTPVEVNRRQVFVRGDRTHLSLDKAADRWLEEHDPLLKKSREEEETASQELFVTGPKRKPDLH